MTALIRLDKKCGRSGIPDSRKCTKTTTALAPEQRPTSNRGLSTSTLLTTVGVTTVAGVLGVIAHDIFTSGVPADKVPPQEAPEGLYDTFKPGDLIYQTNNFGGAARAHYAVYLGKRNGEHMVFDTSIKSRKNNLASILQIRSIEEAKDTGTSYALASRVDQTGKRPTTEQLQSIVERLNGKAFDWTGFESNCETLARSIVNDLPISTQTKNVSGLTRHATKALISALAPSNYRRRAVKQQNVVNLVQRTMARDVKNDSTSRLDKKCGASGIPDGAKCHKGGSWPATAAIAAGLTAGGIAAFAMTRGSASKPAERSAPESGPPRLPGLNPRALLAPAPPRKSKTQRMRENTAAAVRNAEGRIAQTAREEIRRVAQIGNTMAAAGEATGMATKTTLRELRLRTEAARRRFEPGYRAPDQRRLPGGVQAQLPHSNTQPEAVPFDPRTGQPRRRKARGFGRRDNYIPTYAPVRLNLTR